jgi:short-subunit dehydrogenase
VTGPYLLVNNAGFGTSGYFTEIEEKKEETMILLNCLAPVILTRHYLRGMKERNKGAIIFLSSIAANQPSPLGITYSATKVFDQYIGEALHYELKKTKIDVITVLPGATSTEFQQVADYNSIKGARRPEQVVMTSLKKLGKRRVVTDGLSNQIMGFAARTLPRAMAIHFAFKWTYGNIKKKGTLKSA